MIPNLHVKVASLYDAIKHGDDEHKAWLKKAIEAHFAGKPVPLAEGKGNKEARIAVLEQMVQALVDHCPDAECPVCSVIICPQQDPMHFHHDGCPSCEFYGALPAKPSRQGHRS